MDLGARDSKQCLTCSSRSGHMISVGDKPVCRGTKGGIGGRMIVGDGAVL